MKLAIILFFIILCSIPEQIAAQQWLSKKEQWQEIKKSCDEGTSCLDNIKNEKDPAIKKSIQCTNPDWWANCTTIGSLIEKKSKNEEDFNYLQDIFVDDCIKSNPTFCDPNSEKNKIDK